MNPACSFPNLAWDILRIVVVAARSWQSKRPHDSLPFFAVGLGIALGLKACDQVTDLVTYGLFQKMFHIFIQQCRIQPDNSIRHVYWSINSHPTHCIIQVEFYPWVWNVYGQFSFCQVHVELYLLHALSFDFVKLFRRLNLHVTFWLRGGFPRPPIVYLPSMTFKYSIPLVVISRPPVPMLISPCFCRYNSTSFCKASLDMPVLADRHVRDVPDELPRR